MPYENFHLNSRNATRPLSYKMALFSKGRCNQQGVPDPPTVVVYFNYEKMQKLLRNVAASAVEGNTWKKFADPKVNRGITVFPKNPNDQKRLGVRYDYDGEVNKTDGVFHKFQIQPNAGDDVPATIKDWRKAKGGTHAVMGVMFVKKGGNKEDVESALAEAHKGIEGT